MNEVFKYSYVCDGEQTVFEYLFEAFSISCVKVYLDDKLIENNFKIYPFTDRCGGKVVFDFAPLKGKVLTIVRELDFSRVCDFQTGGVLRAEDLNYELNYNIACLNQINNDLKKAIKLSYSSDNVNPVLPPAKAGSAIVWNDKGDGFDNLKVNLSEQVNYVEDCVNYVETVYNDLTDIITNSLDVGILGLFNNLFSLLKMYYPDAFVDLKYISSVADENIDWGFVSDNQNVDVEDNGKL
ncbi:hypothetical protein HDR59_05520 [bacterium]|nr:hypothetical protein [bacterium]